MLIGMIQHRRECALQARHHAALVFAVLSPGLHHVVARGELRIRRHKAKLDLAMAELDAARDNLTKAESSDPRDLGRMRRRSEPNSDLAAG